MQANSREVWHTALRGLRWAQWVVIPAIVFTSLECAARRAQRCNALPIGWNWPDLITQETPLDFIFLGSSRVGGAVDEPTFQQDTSRSLGRPTVAKNLGHGYSYLLQSHLYLRNLWKTRPELLQGTVVIAEAPGGALAFEGQHWDGAWFQPGYEHHLVPLLRVEDLPRFWESRMILADKLAMTFGWAGRSSELVTRRAAIGRWLMQEAQNKVLAWSETLLAASTPLAGSKADLTTKVGIRTDEVGVEQARKMAVENARKKPSETSSSIPPPQQPVFDDLAKLLRDAGARLVFFEMPLHSIQSAEQRTPAWQAHREAFSRQANASGAQFIHLDFATVDEDFPDFWHLRHSRAGEFTAALARGWLDTLPVSASQRPAEQAAKRR